MTTASVLSAPPEPHVLISRLINAPRERVFEAWTAPDQLLQWFAPVGCTIHYEHIDVRPGGVFHSCIRTPQGYECWCTGHYLEVVTPKRLVFSMRNVDASGNPAEPAALGMDPEWPAETVVTVKFEESGQQTLLTLHQNVAERVAKRTGAQPSWLQMLDRLEELTGN